MFDHFALHVSDLPASKAFYTPILSTLGHKIQVESPESGVTAYGHISPKFWLTAASADKGTAVSGPLHLGFEAKDRDQVDAFHAAGLQAGGKSNGEPGVRTYHQFYYAAFLFDPDGNNIECVCHMPPAAVLNFPSWPVLLGGMGDLQDSNDADFSDHCRCMRDHDHVVP
jgi:catechol 2,3-dioxygenase-like lactoylglutathione lyase family enzyme